MSTSIFKGVRDIFQSYWKNYGGWKVVYRSPYLRLSVILSAFLFNIWSKPGWWDLVISIVPSMLGFSLGGLAIFLAFGDSKFISILSGPTKQNKPSPFLNVTTTFTHFLIIQASSLIVALFIKSWYGTGLPTFFLSLISPGKYLIIILLLIKYAIWFFGFLIFTYALLLAVAATMALYRVIRWLDMHHFIQNKRNNINKPRKKFRHQQRINKNNRLG